ncbi:MAG: hypothetical protein FJ333_11105, partial [Sphingomonadales bacterium]|nr:hypothetical protein [Sphingomonadales bacterium]
MICFLKECFSIQKTNRSFNPLHCIHPFSKPLCTLGGFVFKMYKYYYLNSFAIHTVYHEYGWPMRPVSKAEYEFVCFKEYSLQGKKCLSAFNNKNGQKYFKHCIPDLYCETTQELFFFNGCFIHGHYNCPLNKNKTSESPHPFGKTYKDVQESFFVKLKNCMHSNPEIREAHVIWECQFKAIKSSFEFNHFFKHYFQPHPLQRLRPRDTVRGALSDVYALKWSKKSFENETFYCLDVNGLYSYCATNFPFMIGKYEILMGSDLKHLTLKNNKFYLNNVRIMGSMLLTILPPPNLERPFLLYRKKNGSVILALCKECAENELLECNHNDQFRSFTATYMISEIEFALTLGYEIMYIHEAHCYI